VQKSAAAILSFAVLWAGHALAQTAPPLSSDEVSKETDNPVSRHITLPLLYQADFLDGADHLTKSTFEVDQAIVPFRLNDDWSLITRTKLPAEALPPAKAGGPWIDGLSNGYTTFFLSPEYGRDFYWGVGPVLSYPATNVTLGATTFGSGPSIAFMHQDTGPWVYGLVANNIWTFGGATGGNATNQMLLNPFLSYHFGDGWAVSSSPDITANWIAAGNKWTVPFGGVVSKVVQIGELPAKLEVGAYYNAIRPTASQDPWQFQATLTFVFSEQQTRPFLRKEP
jgi:hypothetical protein